MKTLQEQRTEAVLNMQEYITKLEKANEWHYVKDELPPEDVPLLCVRGGKIYVAWYYNSIYHNSNCCQVQKPYAWKEISLPDQEG